MQDNLFRGVKQDKSINRVIQPSEVILKIQDLHSDF